MSLLNTMPSVPGFAPEMRIGRQDCAKESPEMRPGVSITVSLQNIWQEIPLADCQANPGVYS